MASFPSPSHCHCSSWLYFLYIFTSLRNGRQLLLLIHSLLTIISLPADGWPCDLSVKAEFYSLVMSVCSGTFTGNMLCSISDVDDHGFTEHAYTMVCMLWQILKYLFYLSAEDCGNKKTISLCQKPKQTISRKSSKDYRQKQRQWQRNQAICDI